MHGRSADTSLAEIHCELLDKQVNAQKESLKILPGFMQAHENETSKKKMTHV